MNDDERDDTQYSCFTTGDGETVVYDRFNTEAWIRSTVAVPVDEPGEPETSV